MAMTNHRDRAMYREQQKQRMISSIGLDCPTATVRRRNLHLIRWVVIKSGM